MRIGGAVHAPPPSQTGQALLRHPAFRSVAVMDLTVIRVMVSITQTRHNSLTCRYLFGCPLSGHNPFPRSVFLPPTRSALRHYAGPCGLVHESSSSPPSCPPWLHGHYSLLRYYEGSDAGESFLPLAIVP